MSQTPFKTPLPRRIPENDFLHPNWRPARPSSDSEESVASVGSSNSENADSGETQSTNGEISLVAEFDDLMRYYHGVRDELLDTQACFLNVLEQVKELNDEYFDMQDECKRLQSLLDVKVQESSDLDHKLLKARKLLDLEKQHTRNMKRERDELAAQMDLVRNLVADKSPNNQFSEEMRRKFSFLNDHRGLSEWDFTTNVPGPNLSAIKEVNSTGSMLSDFSYSRSEDDLDKSSLEAGKPWKKHRPSTGGVAEPALKKRRSMDNKAVEIGPSDTVRATTTLTVCADGPITATSVIESVPKNLGFAESASTNGETVTGGPPSNLVLESWERGDSPMKPKRKTTGRSHAFLQKVNLVPITCSACDKRIGFMHGAVKCKECKASCHQECAHKLPLPCVPNVDTPGSKGSLGPQGVIGEYTPTTPPMVPALLIHCINEIELRGFSELGIYRVPGAERDVKALKERFLKGKGAPCLEKIDIHVICGTVKDFLRSLSEPLVPRLLIKRFTQALNDIDVQVTLKSLIEELPGPNRDTLACLILHLQRVSKEAACKMNEDNLAKVFGPTIVGFSQRDMEDLNIAVQEVQKQIAVVKHLMRIPSDYWSSFVDVEPISRPSRLQQTPSTDSLLRPVMTRGLFPPNSNKASAKKRQKYFPSPKNLR